MIEQEKKEQIIFALLYTFLKNSKQKKKLQINIQSSILNGIQFSVQLSSYYTTTWIELKCSQFNICVIV